MWTKANKQRLRTMREKIRRFCLSSMYCIYIQGRGRLGHYSLLSVLAYEPIEVNEKTRKSIWYIILINKYVYENKLCLHLASMHSNNCHFIKWWHSRSKNKTYKVFLGKKCSFLNNCCKGCCKSDRLQKYSLLISFGNTANWRQYFRCVLTVPWVTLQNGPFQREHSSPGPLCIWLEKKFLALHMYFTLSILSLVWQRKVSWQLNNNNI